ncbi:MAG: hypothetical protein NTV05_15550 [Acidobacteria bacterium]|nr:hypothetical protein [Acidobacteriota bacterium]
MRDNTMKNILLAVGLALVVAGAGCSGKVNLEKVPVGTQIEVTRQDGGVVTGTLAALDDQSVSITVGSATRVVPRGQIVDVRLVNQTPGPLPAMAKFREFTVPDGTRLAVRLESPVGSDSSRVEDPVEATLTNAILVDGTEVIPAGSVVRGAVVGVQSSGKVKGRGTLALLFSSVSVAGRDERYQIAARVSFLAPSGKNKDIATIGIPAAGGAILGAIFGGKKGAAIGGAIGGGAGTAVTMNQRGPQIHLPRGTVLSLGLDQAVDVRVPIKKG